MKILVVQESDWLERGPHQQHQLFDRLSVRGHEIRVIDFEILWQQQPGHEIFSKRKIFENVWKVDPAAKITVIRPGIIKLPLLQYLSLFFTHHAEIRKQILEFKPDIIVGFGILNNYLALKLAQRNGIPFIYYWIDVLHRLIPLKSAQGFGRLIERRALKTSDKVLTINEQLKNYVISEGASASTEVIGAGIDLDKFNPDTNNTIRAEYGLKATDIVLFFMGWIYHFSGIKEVAIELSKIGQSDIKLLVVGEGDAFEDLKSIREKYGLKDRLILIGKRPYTEMPKFISAADFCILPAYPREKIMQDIVPIKLYEYLAMKKVVICTRLPGVCKEFGDDNGIVYIDNPEDTVTKAIELARDDIIKDLGNRARNFVQKYDWETLTDRFEKILTEEIQKKRNGRSP